MNRVLLVCLSAGLLIPAAASAKGPPMTSVVEPNVQPPLAAPTVQGRIPVTISDQRPTDRGAASANIGVYTDSYGSRRYRTYFDHYLAFEDGVGGEFETWAVGFAAADGIGLVVDMDASGDRIEGRVEDFWCAQSSMTRLGCDGRVVLEFFKAGTSQPFHSVTLFGSSNGKLRGDRQAWGNLMEDMGEQLADVFGSPEIRAWVESTLPAGDEGPAVLPPPRHRPNYVPNELLPGLGTASDMDVRPYMRFQDHRGRVLTLRTIGERDEDEPLMVALTNDPEEPLGGDMFLDLGKVPMDGPIRANRAAAMEKMTVKRNVGIGILGAGLGFIGAAVGGIVNLNVKLFGADQPDAEEGEYGVPLFIIPGISLTIVGGAVLDSGRKALGRVERGRLEDVMSPDEAWDIARDYNRALTGLEDEPVEEAPAAQAPVEEAPVEEAPTEEVEDSEAED